MELKKGNWEKLEGKVMIYAKYFCPLKKDANPRCATCDIANGELLGYLLKKQGELKILPDDAPPELKQIAETLEGLANKIGIAPILYDERPVDLESEIELDSFEGDVLYAGGYTSPKRVKQAIIAARNYYAANFEEQLSKGSEKCACEEGELDYGFSTETDFADKLLETFVNPMIAAKEKGEKDNFEKLKKNLCNSAKGQQYYKLVEKMIKRIDIESQPDLIYAYVKQIDAVYGGKMKLAATFGELIQKACRFIDEKDKPDFAKIYLDQIDAIWKEDYNTASELSKKIEKLEKENGI